MNNKTRLGPTHANDGQTIPKMQRAPQPKPPAGKPTVPSATTPPAAGQPTPPKTHT